MILFLSCECDMLKYETCQKFHFYVSKKTLCACLQEIEEDDANDSEYEPCSQPKKAKTVSIYMEYLRLQVKEFKKKKWAPKTGKIIDRCDNFFQVL